MLAFVALRDGCVTNEDELREHARRRLADLSEHWLVVHRVVHCRFSQMSGIVEATGRESKNENRFCEYARDRAPESQEG